MSLIARELTGPRRFEFTTATPSVDLSSSFELVIPTTTVSELRIEMLYGKNVQFTHTEHARFKDDPPPIVTVFPTLLHPSYEQLFSVCRCCITLHSVHLTVRCISNVFFLILKNLALSTTITDLTVCGLFPGHLSFSYLILNTIVSFIVVAIVPMLFLSHIGEVCLLFTYHHSFR